MLEIFIYKEDETFMRANYPSSTYYKGLTPSLETSVVNHGQTQEIGLDGPGLWLCFCALTQTTPSRQC